MGKKEECLICLAALLASWSSTVEVLSGQVIKLIWTISFIKLYCTSIKQPPVLLETHPIDFKSKVFFSKHLGV